MRRSRAPSVRQKRQQYPATEERALLSNDGNSYYGNNYELKNRQSTNERDRTFNVLWRFVTTKKHKVWKGDGSLVVKAFTRYALLKDESGKVLAEGTINNTDELVVNNELILEDKEFELLEEVNNATREALKEVDCGLINNYKDNSVSSKKRKKDVEGEGKESAEYNPQVVSSSRPEVFSNMSCKFMISTWKETILCVRCSELQHYLIDQTFEYYEEKKDDELRITQNIIDVLQNICTHPSLLSEENIQNGNHICKILANELPEKHEMGPFDSAKLDFVQQFLSEQQNKPQTENASMILILTRHEYSTDMLHGLCDFMNIPYIKITAESENDLDDWFESYNQSSPIAVGILRTTFHRRGEDCSEYLRTLQSIFKQCSGKCQYIIIFEEICSIRNDLLRVQRSLDPCDDSTDTLIIKSLVTAFTIEEALSCLSDESQHPLGGEMNKDFIDKLSSIWKNQKIESFSNDWHRKEQTISINDIFHLNDEVSLKYM